MEHLIGKLVKVNVDVKGENLFFLGSIIAVDSTHFYLIDKFGENYGFRRSDLVEIKEVKA